MSTSPLSNRVEGNPYRIRDPHASSLTEIWVVSAVVAILAIRGYLALTGYPQVGGGNLHIAHMLWGGLGMAIGFGMLIIFAHQVWQPIAAMVTGVGFGTFIDELGKFITKDNDYFYRPTIALIYAIFIALFLLARYFGHRRIPTEADHLYLAVRGLQWQAIGKLDASRQRIALEHLDASGNTSPFAQDVRHQLETADLIEAGQESRILGWRQWLVDRYWQIVGNHWVERIVIIIFVFKAVDLLGTLALGINSGAFTPENGFSFSEWGATIAGAVSGVLAVYGLVRLAQRLRLSALHAFAGSTLVALLFGQFFAFASSQLVALGSLLMQLLILGALRFAISAESEWRSEGEHGERRLKSEPEIEQLV